MCDIECTHLYNRVVHVFCFVLGGGGRDTVQKKCLHMHTGQNIILIIDPY